MVLYKLLDIFFFVFHTVLTLFNISGWILTRCRFLNLITLSITAFSWFILGIWYGFGYCFCTDWHWTVRRILGYRDTSNSYIHFLIFEFTGKSFPEGAVNILTLLIFLSVYILSITLNLKDYLNRNGSYEKTRR